MIDGILPINKEEGITAYDVIRKLKKVLPKGQKIGHAGTLDPFATGLLVILLGKCTKLMDTFHTFNKEYTVKAEFGYATDTQDVTGQKTNFLEKKQLEKKRLSKEEIQDAISRNLIGRIEQMPPIYSAKKVKGQRAYDIARSGKTVQLKPKEIEVLTFQITEYDWPFCSFKILCSTGTYVRTLVYDLGNILGTYATAIELCRQKVGRFDLNSAFDSENIEQERSNEILEKVININNLKL